MAYIITHKPFDSGNLLGPCELDTYMTTQGSKRQENGTAGVHMNVRMNKIPTERNPLHGMKESWGSKNASPSIRSCKTAQSTPIVQNRAFRRGM